MLSKRVLIIAAVLTVTTLGVAQVATRSTSGSVPQGSGPDAVAILSVEPQRLGQEFTSLANSAVAPQSSGEARRAFVAFLQGELATYLSAAIVLYPLADSIGETGGYAVASALFDGEAIARQVKELDRLAGTRDVVAFRARTLVLSELLDTYFTKERLLIAPILARLSSTELHQLLEEIAEHP